jgi:two-component system sensor histidine kinase ChvG
MEGLLVGFYDTIVALLPTRGDPPAYVERANQQADDYEEVLHALAGEPVVSVRQLPGGHRLLIAAVPVQRFKQVLGALMVTTTSSEIERAVRDVRFGILKVFAVALGVTVLLSLFLAGTIARPIRRLAEAANMVRGRLTSEAAIPDFTNRNDEIGDLSGALRDMTNSLWERMQAIESFAADVSHEIKNPLTSLRSAVETAARIKDPEQQRRLMDIIQEDVKRLDRLITDISGASRLDAELARAEFERIDVGRLLQALAQVHQSTDATDRAALESNLPSDAKLYIRGIEGRIVQVVQNLIGNAISFTPADKSVRLAAVRDDGVIEITVDDDGPGIPEANLASVFERFYSERPDGEQFGTHSGLGLSISRQIVEAHGGTIKATNRYDSGGAIVGACFTVRLPAA